MMKNINGLKRKPDSRTDTICRHFFILDFRLVPDAFWMFESRWAGTFPIRVPSSMALQIPSSMISIRMHASTSCAVPSRLPSLTMTTSQRYWSSRPVRYWQSAARLASMTAASLYAGTTTDTRGLDAVRAVPSGPPPAGRDFVSDPVIESVMFIASLLLSSEGTPPAPSEASARSRRPRENRPSAPRGRAPERTLEAQRKPYEAQP